MPRVAQLKPFVPPPTKRVARLKTLNDVRRYLAALVNETRAREVDPALASKLGYLLNILSGCIKDSEVEDRLAALEDRLLKSKQPLNPLK